MTETDIATNEATAETFDIDAWLQDAHLPEDSCVIYKRPDVIAELSELKSRIEDEQAADAKVGKTVGSKSELGKLQKRYDELLDTFADSRATIYVRAIPDSVVRDIYKKYPLPSGKNAQVAGSEASIKQGYELVAEAVVGIQDADGERHDVNLTVDQVKALEGRIGGAQIGGIRQAWQRAQGQTPEVTVDFLSQSSGTSRDDISD